MNYKTTIDGFKFVQRGLAPTNIKPDYDAACEPIGEEPAIDIITKRRGRTFIDVGSNVGLYAIRAAKYFYAVYCFEPNAWYMAGLVENAHLNDYRNIYFIEDALSDQHEVIYFPDNQWATPHTEAQGMANEYAVTCKMLDEYDIQNIDIIKIDVEGWEYKVLMGGKQTIERDRPTMLIESHDEFYGYHNEPLIRDYLASIDYEVYIIQSGHILPHLYCIPRP